MVSSSSSSIEEDHDYHSSPPLLSSPSLGLDPRARQKSGRKSPEELSAIDRLVKWKKMIDPIAADAIQVLAPRVLVVVVAMMMMVVMVKRRRRMPFHVLLLPPLQFVPGGITEAVA